ncbi:nuclease-related domain-containing protein [Domibacillus epiphyticus]|uniref:NERD domain-containing protein n=1 Tax=Domibacillus epiphyticus TaxID=1714355 RepID=A0A1V2A6K3_9BACI|nr:nuclease-related domain-containing protein [Domibacillus epiphyticus]OMP66618.1 hypothetical protein BTO28_11260 [Domibacillus epiphyticus]
MKKSILFAKLESLDRRLKKPSREVKEEIARCAAGFEGERKLLYYLSEINGPVRILHDIRLPFPNGFAHFQIDTIVITRSLLIVIDAKHFTGHLIFDRNTRQLIRGQKMFEDPITQVHRHKRGLEHWLDKPVPIIPLVALTHSNVRMEMIPPDSPDQSIIMYVQEIPAKVDELHHQKTPILTEKEVHLLANKFQSYHRPYDPDVTTLFQIRPDQLKHGIQCPQCKMWSVKRVKRKWICSECRAVLKDPHLPALKDYVRLFGVRAVNRQIREFTGIESASTVKKLLRKWAVDKAGETKGRVYILPEEWKWE